MRRAELAGAMKIPVERIDTQKVMAQTTYRYLPMGETEPVLVEGYRLDGDFLYVPRQYGLELCEELGIEWDDCTSYGSPVQFPRVPEERKYQEEPIYLIEQSFVHDMDTVFRAHTGWGKTIGSLIVAARLGVTTLIVVDQENLKDQWIGTLVDHFGFAARDIGILQGKKLDYRGRAVCIAMVQTIAPKDLEGELREYFGLVILDEVHSLGAPSYSKALMIFSATYRLAVSATPRRRDGLQKALDHHLGPVRVAADKEYDEATVFMIDHHTVYSWYANISPKIGRIINEVADDGLRNLKIADAVVYMYDAGHDVLVMSDRVEHMEDMASLLKYMGIPEEDIGVYTSMGASWQLAKDPRPARRPRGWERNTEYTPVKLQRVRRKRAKAQLKSIKETKRILLSTYKMFSKGVDEPRLSGGCDATPRSTSEQTHGRTRRAKEGKKQPLWVTIVDRNSYRLLFSFLGRAREYVKTNSKLYQWTDDGEVIPCNPKELFAEISQRIDQLKEQQIVSNADGTHTLTTKPTASDKRQSHANSMREWAKLRSREKSPRVEPGERSPSREPLDRSRLRPSASRKPRPR